VTPTTPAAFCAVRQEARKPPPVHGLLVVLTKISGLVLGVASSAALSGAPTLTRRDVEPTGWARNTLCDIQLTALQRQN
jgi:hypothetical protein